MNVPTEYKMQMLSTAIPTMMDFLAGGAPDGDVTADDIVDLFGIAIAAVLDNDSHLRTARDLRLGAETVAKCIEVRAKEFRVMQQQAGISWLSATLGRGQAEVN